MEIVPKSELISRVDHLQRLLAEADISLALIRQPADLFYYTGTVVEGFLAAPATGKPLLLVRRPRQHPAVGETPWETAFYGDLKELPGFINEMPVKPDTIGLELDVLPASLYVRLKDYLFPQAAIKDLSLLVRRQRMVKSAYELERIGRAAAMLDLALEEAPNLIKPGVSELELTAAIEYRLRQLEHQGLVRVRRWDMEMFYGHVLSGVSGLTAAYVDTPSGGLGFSPAFPQGAGRKLLAAGEPISIDLAACVDGYVADMTRLYAIRELPAMAWRAYDLILELFRIFESEVRAGVQPGDLYQRLVNEVDKHGWGEYFMGWGADRVSFIGHGVGLELDELPLLTARSPFPFEADMVLAFEPKLFLPEIGMVGLEDTGRITDQGVEWLTRSSRQVTII
ncbi:MAG: Xaa-Pro peptidase family protein [Deltaproteobacteria bacterium]|nr:Xaa-Pro peptidase family protein [Deltaproteobacteria bacterium]